MDRHPDVLLAGFESRYGHSGDQNARESEIFEVRDDSVLDIGHTYSTVGLSCKSRGELEDEERTSTLTYHAGRNFNVCCESLSEDPTIATIVGTHTRQVRTPATRTAWQAANTPKYITALSTMATKRFPSWVTPCFAIGPY
jgi:hypothetical protein